MNQNFAPLMPDVCGDRYEINCDGIIRFAKDTTRMSAGTIVKHHITGKGYCRIGLKTLTGQFKLFYVHRLVALTFIQPIDGKPCVNHIDGNKTHNATSNLEWVTHSENEVHKYYVLFSGNNKCKPVVAFDKYGSFVGEWPSTMVAARETKTYSQHISAVCRGERKTAGGLLWKFKSDVEETLQNAA